MEDSEEEKKRMREWERWENERDTDKERKWEWERERERERVREEWERMREGWERMRENLREGRRLAENESYLGRPQKTRILPFLAPIFSTIFQLFLTGFIFCCKPHTWFFNLFKGGWKMELPKIAKPLEITVSETLRVDKSCLSLALSCFQDAFSVCFSHVWGQLNLTKMGKHVLEGKGWKMGFSLWIENKNNNSEGLKNMFQPFQPTFHGWKISKTL